MRHHLAIAACLVLSGSIANASPSHHHRHHHKKHRVATEETVELRDDVTPSEHAGPRDWHLAIGPYVWASSVDANVSLGSANVGSSVDFLQTTQHAKFGAELLADARYHRLSFSGDLMYGVVGLEGGNTVGPLMVTVNGTASSLLVDGYAGYQLAGDEHSVLGFEARAGIRYQRTAVAGAVGLDGMPVASPGLVDAGRDILAAGRLFVRPSSRFFLTATGDVGVVGSSSSTWSASADASVRLGSRVLLSLGYRTLTIERAHMSMVMHGPRAALQLLF
jgi:hypothetical protein